MSIDVKFLYFSILFMRQKDGGYSVTFPDIPGCIMQGDTKEEALKMATEALSSPAGHWKCLTT